MDEDHIERYMAKVYLSWPKRTGMNEEIALRMLMMNGYDVQKTLGKIEAQHMGASYEVVHMINSMN